LILFITAHYAGCSRGINREHVTATSRRVHDLLLTKPSMLVSETFHFYGICRKNKEPTSGLEPLTCSLRVIGQALLGAAWGCKSPISRRLSLLRVAGCCTVLRSRWYRSGINSVGMSNFILRLFEHRFTTSFGRQPTIQRRANCGSGLTVGCLFSHLQKPLRDAFETVLRYAPSLNREFARAS
jgi:hypothetical protein